MPNDVDFPREAEGTPMGLLALLLRTSRSGGRSVLPIDREVFDVLLCHDPGFGMTHLPALTYSAHVMSLVIFDRSMVLVTHTRLPDLAEPPTASAPSRSPPRPDTAACLDIPEAAPRDPAA